MTHLARVTKIQGSQNSDFQYAGYYYHAPSGLNLTLNRAYNSSLGRWISRDPIGEAGGINLYAYTSNSPIMKIDLTGLYWGLVRCIFKDPHLRDPYSWTHNIFGNETGIQWYISPNGQITGIPYFGNWGQPGTSNAVDMPPNNIPSWGELITDIHTHPWGDTSFLKYYTPPDNQENDPNFGLKTPNSPFDFSGPDKAAPNNLGTPGLLIDPLGNIHQYDPFPSPNFDTEGITHSHFG